MEQQITFHSFSMKITLSSYLIYKGMGKKTSCWPHVCIVKTKNGIAPIPSWPSQILMCYISLPTTFELLAWLFFFHSPYWNSVWPFYHYLMNLFFHWMSIWLDWYIIAIYMKAIICKSATKTTIVGWKEKNNWLFRFDLNDENKKDWSKFNQIFANEQWAKKKTFS